MINIFEAKSYRVKGISFHHKNPWVLTSLHNGQILLYDYINQILLDKFEEHEGPVRAINFHNSQPFFVSGGDDCKVKIWNYSTKKCQYNLGNHNDYIRTVQFHHELSWVISASDDQTIRIWNWLNRTLLTTVTGHDHYVMSAFFHPSQDIIVSASLDQTIRVWDYTTLRKKYSEARTNAMEVISMDIVVKFRLEGHERGVNWATFHPKLPLIASGSDDKNIKIWKYSDTKGSEVDTLRGHFHNVSSVMFHPRLDYLISNSEDRSIRIWDLNKKTYIEKITKDTDRFWILGIHPTLSIFASGCDSGLNVFKLENSKIPSAVINNQIVLYQNKTIRIWKAAETESRQILEFKHSQKSINSGIKRIVYNPFQNTGGLMNFFILTDASNNNKVYYFYLKTESGKISGSDQVLEFATCACFISNNKVLTLTTSGALIGYDSSNINNKFLIEVPGVAKEAFKAIYQGPLGKFICMFKNGMLALIDANSKKIVKEINEVSELKYIVWNSGMTLAALVSKNCIHIINKNFELLTKVKENCAIKSVSFDEQNILFYTTNFHIKYILQDGLKGIIKSTEITSYLMMVHNSIFYLSDALQNFKTERFNYTECRFKIALLNKNYDEVVNILKSGAIYGIKAVEDIQNAGFPDLSLKFVTDPKQKFHLALQSGKLEEAQAAADLLKNKEYYNLLAEKAMMIGKLSIAEYCYVRSKNLDKLIFFYLLSGRYDKLKLLEDLLQKENDNSRRFLNCIYTGNVTEKIKMLSETGHLSLSLLTAKIYNNEQLENSLVQNSHVEIPLNDDDVEKFKNSSKPMVPLKPILSYKNKDYHSNWVTITEFKRANLGSNLDNFIMDKSELESTEINEMEQILNEKNSDKIDNKTESPKQESKKTKVKSKWADEEEEENIDDDLNNDNVNEEENDETNTKSTQHLTYKDDDIIKKAYENSRVPGVQLLLGNLQVCTNLLKNQICLESHEALKNTMKEIYLSNYAQLKFLPFLNSSEINLRKFNNEKLFYNSLNSLNFLNQKLKSGYELTTEGEIEEALKVFREILKFCLFFVSQNEKEDSEIKNIVSICTEYIYLMRLNIFNKNNKEDKVKYAEKACLMTICKLEEPIHYFYMYRKAKIANVNIKNYLSATYFCKKIISLEKSLENEVEADEFRKAKKEFENYQKIGSNAVTLEFNINEIVNNAKSYICGRSLSILQTLSIKCPYCQSIYSKEHSKSGCDNCNISVIGKECIGLTLSEGF